MDMRHLRSFVAVAEELSFSRAAERLHMSQPPLSQHIKSIEDEMGVKLFLRSPREVKLTDAGLVFLQESRVLLDQLRIAINATVRAAQSDSGILRIGVATAALFGVMPQFMTLMRATFPNVNVSVTDMQSQDQLVAVTQGSIDIGIVHVRPDRMKLEHLPIFSESLAVVLPEAHPLTQVPHLRLCALADEPMIAISREHGPAVYDAVVSSCVEAGFRPAFKHIARNPTIIFQMVRLGLGVSVVPRSYAQSTFPGVCFRDLPETTGRVRMEAIWSERRASELTLHVTQQILPLLVAPA